MGQRFLVILLPLLVVAGLAWPVAVHAQPMRLDTPVDSPLWWTLTDDLTPAEVKRLYSDRALSLERYDAAVEAGLAPPLPERGKDSRECLQFYVNPELTPELEPMWFPFQTFYALYTPGEHAREEYVEAAPRDLQQKFGVSPSGVDAIMSAAAATQTEFDSLMADLGPKLQEMTLLLAAVYEDPLRAAFVPPEGQVYDAVRQQDYATVSSVVGRPESEIHELVDSHADWDVPYALIAEALPGLKAALTDHDWQGFRHYLLETVVARQGSFKEFDAFCGGSGQ